MRSNLTIPHATWIGRRRSSELPLREQRQRERRILPAIPHSEVPVPIARHRGAEETAYPAAGCGIQASDRFPDAESPCARAGWIGSIQFAHRASPPTEKPPARRAAGSSNRRSLIVLQACITV